MAEKNYEEFSPTLKEAPYYHDGMTFEEYDIEREYYLKNLDLVHEGKYVPLWKQKQNKQ